MLHGHVFLNRSFTHVYDLQMYYNNNSIPITLNNHLKVSQKNK